MIAHRGQAAVDRAGADRDQDLGVLAQFAQHMHVLGVADAALDQRDVAGPAMLDVGDRRAVEFGDLDELENALVDVEQRHVAAEAARERCRRDPHLDAFPGGAGIVHLKSPQWRRRRLPR